MNCTDCAQSWPVYMANCPGCKKRALNHTTTKDESMAASTEDLPAGVEELYQSASNTSNLKIEADRRGPGDIIIAAGWSMSHVGMALLRLHSEWDASEKPPKPTKAAIEALVGTYQRILPGESVATISRKKPLSGSEAAHYANRWYAHELTLLLGKLKALADVREQVTLQALRWGMGRSQDPVTNSEITESREQDAEMVKRLRAVVDAAGDDQAMSAAAKVALSAGMEHVSRRRAKERADETWRAADKSGAVIRYWLDQTCGACHGLKWQMIPGTPALSGRYCQQCGGSGVSQPPHQEQGKRLANYLDDCVSRARQSMKNRLRSVET